MNKRLFVILTAALLLVSATACNAKKDSDGDATRPEDGSDGFIVVTGTDAQGNDITYTEVTPSRPTDPEDDLISEQNPQFKDISKKVYVWTAVATVRANTVIADNNAVGWPQEGRVLDVTGESAHWYRIKYENKDRYIAKTVVGDYSVLEAFKPVDNEEIEIEAAAVNVRSFPSTESSRSIRGSLKKGTKVTRVGISDGWSRILYEVVSETETDASGKPATVIKQYYISNDCIVDPSASTQAATSAENGKG